MCVSFHIRENMMNQPEGHGKEWQKYLSKLGGARKRSEQKKRHFSIRVTLHIKRKKAPCRTKGTMKSTSNARRYNRQKENTNISKTCGQLLHALHTSEAK